VVTSQLCKTNPIPKTPESPQSLLPQRLTPIFAFTPVKKTNPIKPNFKIGKMKISTEIVGFTQTNNEQRTMNNEHDSKQTQFPAPSAAEGPSPRIHTPFTLLAQDGMNRDCFAERGLEQANAANRKEVMPLNVRCN
jgi:hypothetical protein